MIGLFQKFQAPTASTQLRKGFLDGFELQVCTFHGLLTHFEISLAFDIDHS